MPSAKCINVYVYLVSTHQKLFELCHDVIFLPSHPSDHLNACEALNNNI